MNKNLLTIIKGAGEMASGVAWRLHKSHIRVLMTETHQPLSVRRAVSFCEAVYEGRMTVEGVEAVLVSHADECLKTWGHSQIPVLVDPRLEVMNHIQADTLVEATLSKRNTGIHKKDAPLVIALGPGYDAGHDAHFVVETHRGHHLGRIVESGYARENTGIPGIISGYGHERVLRAPTDGILETRLVLGDAVDTGQIVATVSGVPVKARIPGILRGFMRAGTPVKTGLKMGDIDPRGDSGYVKTISEKARAIGGSVLECICRKYNSSSAWHMS